MRIVGFQCDRCGKIVTDADFNRLTEEEVGKEFLSAFEGLGKMELCDDCYKEFRDTMRDEISYFIDGQGEDE